MVVSLGLWDYAPGVGIVVLALAVGCVCVIIAARVSSRARTAIRREVAILRVAVGSLGTVAAVTAASVVVIACLVATFVVACVAVGVDAPLGRLIGLAVIVILAGSIPFNIGGWGPREGVAAWAFALAGLGATTGIAVSIAYGVLAMIAVTPGAAVLAASELGRRRRRRRSRSRGRGGAVMNRPYVTLSCAMSIDGYLDSASPRKLAMSNAEDFDRVDQLRADSDAIMVGASTVRRDDPRLLVRSDERRLRRLAAGRSFSPAKVTVTASGELPLESSFFTAGDVDKLVYCPSAEARRIESRLGRAATVIGLGDRVTMEGVLEDLPQRGVERLMVEGGGRLLTQFLVDDLADELQLVVAPFFVGESRAPRIVETGRFPWTATRRATLADTRRIADVVLLRYALSDRFEADAGRSHSADRLPARP